MSTGATRIIMNDKSKNIMMLVGALIALWLVLKYIHSVWRTISVSLIIVGYLAIVVSKISARIAKSQKQIKNKLMKWTREKDKLITESINLIERPIDKYGNIKINELDAGYFVGNGEPHKRMKKIKRNMEIVRRINSITSMEIQKLISIDDEERKRVNYLLLHQSSRNKDAKYIDYISSEGSDIKGPLTERERELIQNIKRIKDIIVKNKIEVSKRIEAENVWHDKLRSLLVPYEIKRTRPKDLIDAIKSSLPSASSASGSQKVIRASVDEIEKIMRGIEATFIEVKKRIVAIINDVFDDRQELRELLHELAGERTSPEKRKLLVEQSSTEFDIIFKDNNSIKITNIIQLIIVLRRPDANLIKQSVDDMIKFIKSIPNSGDLSKEIEKQSLGGRSGIWQLLKTLETYFKMDSTNKKTFTYQK